MVNVFDLKRKVLRLLAVNFEMKITLGNIVFPI